MGSVWELNAPSNGLPMLLIDGVFNGSYKFFLSGFSTGYFHVKIFALGRSVSLIFFFIMRMQNWHLNTAIFFQCLNLMINQVNLGQGNVLISHRCFGNYCILVMACKARR